MRIQEQALSKINSSVRLKTVLALELSKSVATVSRWISDNTDNNPLTTAKALQLIREETGLEDSQILEETTADHAA